MNARSGRWENAAVSVDLPCAGVFVVRDGLIVQRDDYWDVVTMPCLA